MRANAHYTSPDGIKYTVWSCRTEWLGPRGRKHAVKVVRAYTHDLTEDSSNGNLDGVPVHWVVLPVHKFEDMFTSPERITS